MRWCMMKTSLYASVFMWCQECIDNVNNFETKYFASGKYICVCRWLMIMDHDKQMNMFFPLQKWYVRICTATILMGKKVNIND